MYLSGAEGKQELERAHVYVSGRVQGVFFRDSTREEARRLGLSGWVENLPDGRVEAVFQGPSEAVRQMVRWCKEGPSHADVDGVQTDFEDASEDLQGFQVR